MVRPVTYFFALVSLALFTAVAARADVSPAPGLKPSGIKRCLNFGNALEAPHEVDWGYVIQQTDIRKARLAGYDAIRIPMAWGAGPRRHRPMRSTPPLSRGWIRWWAGPWPRGCR